METDVIITMVFGVVGGLGIFLLGMKNMSEGMQAVAGDKLRKLIGIVTNHRIAACGVGTLITCLVQSSSITTVMVVGMVNAGIMNLMQAMGVILGANIGTTITGWILVIKIGKYGLPLLGLSAFFFLFSKRDKVRYTASIFLGLGMVFYGLQLMKHGFAPLKGMPEFVEWFSRFSPETYFGVLKCCLVGALLTAIVQSSSATLGITIGLASTGVIDFYTAAALVLGENIGTTITAYLASLGASVSAKRASYGHIFFNLLGVVWITAIFPFYMKIVIWVIGVDPTIPIMENGVETFQNSIKGIAMTHTGFNVVNVLIFLPFLGLLCKLLYRVVPDKAIEEEPRLTFLDVRMLDTPAISIQQSRVEVLRMGREVNEMFGLLKDVLLDKGSTKEQEERIFNMEGDLDVIQKEVVEFIGNIMTGRISHEVMGEGHSQVRMADEYESISDYITNILKLNLKVRGINERISDEGLDEILDLHEHVGSYINFINDSVNLESRDILSKAESLGHSITAMMKKYRSNHLVRVEKGYASPQKSLFFTDILNSYRRIKDHALNIAEVLAGEK